MRFNGLVVTDALVMEAISARHGAAEAAVLAFEAGADLILMPADADAAIDGLCDGFSSGRLCLERLDESLQRRAHALASIPTSTATGPIVSADEQALEAELVRHSITVGEARFFRKQASTWCAWMPWCPAQPPQRLVSGPAHS